MKEHYPVASAFHKSRARPWPEHRHANHGLTGFGLRTGSSSESAQSFIKRCALGLHLRLWVGQRLEPRLSGRAQAVVPRMQPSMRSSVR